MNGQQGLGSSGRSPDAGRVANAANGLSNAEQRTLATKCQSVMRAPKSYAYETVAICRIVAAN